MIWEDKEMFPKTQEDKGVSYNTRKDVMMMFPMIQEAKEKVYIQETKVDLPMI